MNKEQTELWEYMEEMEIATRDEMILVTKINGMTLESLESILYVKTGYRSLKQIQDL